MNRKKIESIVSYLATVVVLIFLIIDPMGILNCKTGTCSISPVRELIGWSLLYFSISEIIFTPLITFKEKLRVTTSIIIGLLVVITVIEIFVLKRYEYLTLVNFLILFKLRKVGEDIE